MLKMNNSNKSKSGLGIGVGAAVGVAIGVAVGSSSGNTSQFIGLCLAVRTAFGALVDFLRRRK
jgi:hypothetical protein